ncbi:hypothetical protein BASA81_000823 [Batrachochytrium salamandrivorans]|nr:hypothetical protein BASA81_000823 [Batrachochytrium salamandrivorans]
MPIYNRHGQDGSVSKLGGKCIWTYMGVDGEDDSKRKVKRKRQGLGRDQGQGHERERHKVGLVVDAKRGDGLVRGQQGGHGAGQRRGGLSHYKSRRNHPVVVLELLLLLAWGT